ncbi:MAG: efflux RND transporter permease subunit, partial [Muribaculaceae bacterium]|nr:efflux RND transporter permease subunit [Muribaculaceae bacterium]
MKARSFSIIIIFIALAMLGCALIPRLPVKLMPSRTLPGLSVSFSMPDASARVVESEVTSKLESMLARIGGIKSINSTSSNGSGYISLGFDKNTDMQQ